MSAQEDRDALSQTIRSLKQDLDGIDFKTVSADDSDAWLDRIADVYIQIKRTFRVEAHLIGMVGDRLFGMTLSEAKQHLTEG